MKNSLYFYQFFISFLLLTPLTVQAALLSRIGGQAVYDDDLNVTWVADANLALSFNFGLIRDAPGTRFTFDGHIREGGLMNFVSAQSWVAGMNSATYLGASNWRLPTPNSLLTPGLAGEFNHLFFTEFNGITNHPVGTIASPNLDLINNLLPFDSHTILSYWNEQQLSFGLEQLTDFNFRDGVQTSSDNFSLNRVWVLRDGDIALAAATPIPAAVWLFGSGLIGLAGIASKRKG